MKFMRLIENYRVVKRRRRWGWALFSIAKIDRYENLNQLLAQTDRKIHSCTPKHCRTTFWAILKKNQKLHDRPRFFSSPVLLSYVIHVTRISNRFRFGKKKTNNIYFKFVVDSASSQTFGLCVKQWNQKEAETKSLNGTKKNNKNL